MDSIPLLDRVDIHIFQPHPGHFNVDFVCKEANKQLTFDPKALSTLQEKVYEKAKDKPANDANTRGYIEEYVGRLITEYHKHGLCVIEDIPDAPDDPYAALRRQLN